MECEMTGSEEIGLRDATLIGFELRRPIKEAELTMAGVVPLRVRPSCLERLPYSRLIDVFPTPRRNYFTFLFDKP